MGFGGWGLGVGWGLVDVGWLGLAWSVVLVKFGVGLLLVVAGWRVAWRLGLGLEMVGVFLVKFGLLIRVFLGFLRRSLSADWWGPFRLKTCGFGVCFEVGWVLV